jgi:hypothetical protein
MMGPDPGEIEVKMQRSISRCQRRMAGYGRRLKP